MSQEYCVQITRKRKECVEPDCCKSARSRTDKCIAHGGGHRCVEPNCDKGATNRSYKCITHGGGHRCVEPNCDKGAAYGFDKCKKHGGGSRCVEPDCKSGARDETQKCKKHGGGHRCVEPNCKASAVDVTKCKKHGGGSRCVEPNCDKNARNGSDNCKKHGGGLRCVEPDCKVSARDGSNKCRKHGGGSRCPNCIDWIDSRSGSSAYDGYCATCFKETFPDDKRSKVVYRHTKEIMVRNFINANFDGFMHDKPLYTGNCDCTHKRRIDHRKLIGNTILAIETDEFGHRSYDARDEEIRYDDLFMIHSGKWIFIRFNPDTNVSKTRIDDKLNSLLETMKECVYRIEQGENIDLVEIIKLYC